MVLLPPRDTASLMFRQRTHSGASDKDVRQGKGQAMFNGIKTLGARLNVQQCVFLNKFRK